MKKLTERQQHFKHYLSALFKKDEIIEFRLIHRDARENKKVENYWTTVKNALEFDTKTEIYKLKDGKPLQGTTIIFDFLSVKNKDEFFNIYVGINPRPDYGHKKSDGIETFRTIYADIDGQEANDNFLKLLEDPSLLEPTFITNSGNGYRPYYILNENMSAEQFTALQKALIKHFDGDPSIHDPARVDRVPGFFNHKPKKPTTKARIIQEPNGKTYSITALQTYFCKPEPILQVIENNSKTLSDTTTTVKVGKWEYGTDIIEGNRHTTLLSISCHYQTLGLSKDETKNIILTIVAPYLKNSDGSHYILSEQEAEYYASEFNRYKNTNSSYYTLYNRFSEFREFPVDIFSTEIQTTVYHFVKKYNCVPDYIYNALLSGCATANGTKAVIIARARKTDCKLWFFSVGTSSSGKSSAKDIFEYYRNLDDNEKIAFEERKQVYLKERTVYENQLSSLKRKHHNNLKVSDIPDKPEEPHRREYSFSDGTIEAMNRIIKNAPEGTLLYIDDFYGWYSQLCKFNNATAASNLASLQKYYDNEFYETVKQSRAKEENSLNITKHCLNIYGNIQPEIIKRSIFHPDLKDSGFIHRLLFFYPDETGYNAPPKEEYEIPKKYQDYITNIFDTLANKEYNNGGWSDYYILNLDEQSDEVKDLYYTQVD